VINPSLIAAPVFFVLSDPPHVATERSAIRWFASQPVRQSGRCRL